MRKRRKILHWKDCLGVWYLLSVISSLSTENLYLVDRTFCPWKERIINTIMVSPWRLPTLSVKATVRPLILLQILNNIEENKHPNNFLSTAACCQDQLCKLCHNRCSKPWWAGPGAAWYNIEIMPASRRRLDEMNSKGLLKPAFVFFCDSMFLLGRHSFSVRSYTFTLRI